MFQPTDVFCLDCSIFLKNYSPTFEMIKCLHNKSGSEDLPMLGLACSSKKQPAGVEAELLCRGGTRFTHSLQATPVPVASPHRG